ncbi:hypothetical protein HDV05_004943, partial [Chytridiales sp. JEL 0842]
MPSETTHDGATLAMSTTEGNSMDEADMVLEGTLKETAGNTLEQSANRSACPDDVESMPHPERDPTIDIESDSSNDPTTTTTKPHVIESTTENALDDQLGGLLVGVTDQLELEQKIGSKMLEDLRTKENAADEKRLNKTRDNIRRQKADIESLVKDLGRPNLKISQKQAILDRIKQFEEGLKDLRKEKDEIKARIDSRSANDRAAATSSVGGRSCHQPSSGDFANSQPTQNPTSNRLPNESERDYLIRTGKITPFSAMSGLERGVQSTKVGMTVADLTAGRQREAAMKSSSRKSSLVGSVRLKPPQSVRASENADLQRPKAPGKLKRKRDIEEEQLRLKNRDREKAGEESEASTSDVIDSGDDAEYAPSDENDHAKDESDGEDDIAIEVDDEDDILGIDEDGGFIKRRVDENRDDGDEIYYQKRLCRWVQLRRLRRLNELSPGEPVDVDPSTLLENLEAEALEPHTDDERLEGGYTLPADIASKLFDYQKTCVRWLWELYSQETGGIIGDEMGLGKTIQIISFLSGLHRSGLLNGPILVVAPATVLKQWCNEFHSWWPAFRVAILHSSGSGLGGSSNLRKERYDDDEESDFSEDENEGENADEWEKNQDWDRRGTKRGGQSGRRKKGRVYTDDDDDDDEFSDTPKRGKRSRQSKKPKKAPKNSFGAKHSNTAQ